MSNTQLQPEQVRETLKRIPMRLAGQIAQAAQDHWAWSGDRNYKIILDEAEKIAKQWEPEFKTVFNYHN